MYHASRSGDLTYDERVVLALRELPQIDAECYRLLCRGCTVSEISTLVGTDEEGVRKIIHRVTIHLVRCLSR
jgi:hypothetical protein